MNRMLELITGEDGKLSHSKLAANTGLVVISAAFIMQSALHGVTPELMLVYGGLTSGHYLAKTWINGKYQEEPEKP